MVHTGPSESDDELVAAIRARAKLIRSETVRLIGIAKSGHYTSVFSCAEILATLYSGVMRLNDDPEWAERDRLVVGKGHAAVGLYPLLAERGYFPAEWLDGYTRLGSPLGDHPDMRRVPGIDFSSGSIGHGLSVITGMAVAARLKGMSDTRMWALLGDQELNEGQVWEAAQTASHFDLGNVCAIVDRNQMGLDASTESVMSVEPIADRFKAFGWQVEEVDGHDVRALLATFSRLPAPGGDKPVCIIAHTVKGKGVHFMELSRVWHLGYLAPIDAEGTLAEIDARG
jgi:transketolase